MDFEATNHHYPQPPANLIAAAEPEDSGSDQPPLFELSALSAVFDGALRHQQAYNLLEGFKFSRLEDSIDDEDQHALLLRTYGSLVQRLIKAVERGIMPPEEFARILPLFSSLDGVHTSTEFGMLVSKAAQAAGLDAEVDADG